MADRDQILKWIQWVRENGVGDEKYAPVQTIKVTGLWDDESEEHGACGDRQQTLTAFMDVLSGAPTDFAARFVAMHFYWSATQAARAYVCEERMIFPDDIQRTSSWRS